MKCIIYGCDNDSEDGGGVDLTVHNPALDQKVFICKPCWCTLMNIEQGRKNDNLINFIKRLMR